MSGRKGMLGVRGNTKGMPGDERQSRSKRVAKEGYQMLRDRTEVRGDGREISDDEGEPREMVTGEGSQMMRDSVEGRGC